MGDLSLRPYSNEDFPTLNSWIKDKWSLFEFSGSNWTFPLSVEQIELHLSSNPNRHLFMAESDGETIGCGEVICMEENTPRLGRLLIGEPALRGKGKGKLLIEKLIEKAGELEPSETIYLFVLENNEVAIRCYLNYGFKIDEGLQFELLYENRPYKTYRMSKTI